MPLLPDGGPIACYEMGPLEVLDFGISWAGWLAPGETIAGLPTITQDNGDGNLTINPNNETTLVSGGVVTWWLSTPTVYSMYFVHVTITTNQGRTSTRKIEIKGVSR